MPAVFPAPDHDHDRCSADALAHAEALCVKRGERLTPMRRKVLEALTASHKPLGAYEIIERSAANGGVRPAPITVYRALDFLRDNGFVHRIEGSPGVWLANAVELLAVLQAIKLNDELDVDDAAEAALQVTLAAGRLDAAAHRHDLVGDGKEGFPRSMVVNFDEIDAELIEVANRFSVLLLALVR